MSSIIPRRLYYVSRSSTEKPALSVFRLAQLLFTLTVFSVMVGYLAQFSGARCHV